MSCIHFSANEDAWCDANAAPDLPKSRIPQRRSKRERLVFLADDPRPAIRAAVAGNPETPRYVLVRLASDESPEVRRWVARNFRTPVRALKRLARDEDHGIAAYARLRLSVIWSGRW